MDTPNNDQSGSTDQQGSASAQTASSGTQEGQSGSPNTATQDAGKKAPKAKPEAKQTTKTTPEPNKPNLDTPKAASKKGPETKHEVLFDGKSYGPGGHLPADISETDLKELQAVGAI